MPDQYTRTRAQLGTPALDVLRRAHVAVFGIGGVGGQAVEVLARSGVGELSLFDSDTVALSNLNRQLVALHSTLGQYKVDAMAARIADIDPSIIVHANRMFYNAETAPDVDLTQFDYVLDCIDTVSAKLLLIRCCKKDGVPILCSMGAANKLDPTAFRVADIEKTTVEPAGQGHPPRVPQAPPGQGEGRLFGGADPAAAAGGNRGSPHRCAPHGARQQRLCARRLRAGLRVRGRQGPAAQGRRLPRQKIISLRPAGTKAGRFA